MSMKSRGMVGGEFCKNVISRNLAFLLCLCSFCAGMLFTNSCLLLQTHHINQEFHTRLWMLPGTKGNVNTSRLEDAQISLKFEDGDAEVVKSSGDESIRVPDKKTSELEMKATIARTAHESVMDDFPISENLKNFETNKKRKYFMVIGINTAFNSRKRRDSVRATWMPQGAKRKKLEEEKGIVIRFVIGHSFTPGGVLDKAIEAEETLHGDFLRLDHVEGYMELSAKTKTYFSTAVALWDAEFFIKVDDDVHVNLATLGTTLSRQRLKPRRYIGCMKSGPVLSRKGVKYHEPEYWKFGTVGNNYFRHASGQIYAISRDLAAFISINRHVLHNYANEDVSLGSWLIGLDVVHVDDRRLCCGTPPDCEWKAQAGNICVASFDWKCSGICNPVERIVDVHQRCGEDENALQRASF